MQRVAEHPSPLVPRPWRRPPVLIAGGALLIAIVFMALGMLSLGGALSLPESVLLGVTEGVTEFLPVSSTGHLLIVERIFGMGTSPVERAALDSYAIAIQGGAILAVAWLYRARLQGMLRIRTAGDRQVLLAVVLAAAPAGVCGLAFGDAMKDRLFDPAPVAIAWLVGGIALLLIGGSLRGRTGSALDLVTSWQAVVIGAAQVIALWPGVSRSLVTIVAGVLVGLSLAAAVELSFLLGFVTLLGATGLETLRNGGAMVETLGWTGPLVGFVAAFGSAIVAIRWLVRVVATSDLRPFGIYRIAAAGCVALLLATGLLAEGDSDHSTTDRQDTSAPSSP